MSDANEPTGSESDNEFGVLCGLCRTRMYATPDQIGQTIQCPDCHSDHTITAADERMYNATRFRANKPASPLDQSLASGDSDADAYQLAPMDETPTVQTDATSSAPQARDATEYIRAPCPICNWFYVGQPTDVGQPTTCHDCGNVFEIKPRNVAKKVDRVVAYDPKIGIAAAPKLPEQENRSDELMAKAHAHREKIDKDKPKPPKRPFSEGIYNFPFMPRVIQAWVPLPILFCLGMAMVAYGLSMEGKAQIIGMLVFVAALPFLALTAYLIGFSMMTLMTTTANGYPQPVEWPRFDFGEWFVSGIFFWSSFFVAVLPGAALSTTLPWYGKLAFYSVSLMLLHPFVFLSMMDANSAVLPYTPHIHRCLKKAPSAWTKFYLALAPVAAAAFGLLALAGVSASKPTIGIALFIVATTTLAIGMTIYFRLLGRLAWVLGDVPTIEEERESLAEDE